MTQDSTHSPCSWRCLARGWNRFFHRPVDTLSCDIVRIGYALLILLQCATTWSHVVMWYGESGVLPFQLSRQAIDSDTWTIFQWLPATDATAWWVFGALTVQAVLLLLGIQSRWQALGVYIWLISLHHRNVLVLDAEDGVFRVFGFLLMWMPLGQHLSVDAWWRQRRMPRNSASPLRPCWALRLLQIEMSLIFAGCAFSKAASPFWLDGTAMFYATRLDDLFQHYPTPAFLWESMTGLTWMGYGVILLEATVPLLIWFRETRWVALGMAAVFHISCEYTMNLYLFHWIMLVGWCSFISSAEWRYLWGRCCPGGSACNQGASSPDRDTQHNTLGTGVL